MNEESEDIKNQAPRITLHDIKSELGGIGETLKRMSRNQTLAILMFGVIMLVVLIQGQKLTIKIPGLLEISSAEVRP